MNSEERNEKPIIRVRGLHKFFGSMHLIKGVDLDVRPGEVVVIMGPSGAGKSTFLRCLNYLEEPSSGTIEIDGVKIDAQEPVRQRNKQIRNLRRKAAMVFQEFNLFPHLTVLGNVIEGTVRVKGVPQKQAIVKGEELLAGMGLLARADDFPSQLAVGEQQRVAIARSLCMEPKINLFDDPTSALDPNLVIELIKVIARLANKGIAMIVVTNEPYLTRHIADWVILLDEGIWVEMAPPNELFDYPEKERTRQFLARISLKDISGGV